MRDSDYIGRLKAHLATYREQHLLVSAPGTWGSPPRPYAHILPLDYRDRNIVTAIREPFWRAHTEKGWTLHKYFHHLSSSQVLAFNIFFAAYPMLPTTFVAFRRVLQLDSVSECSVDFEVVLDQEEGTNIDVLLESSAGNRTIIEIKLTEQSFGRAKADQRHLDKLRDIYRPRLCGRLAEECLDPTTFLKDYQLFRNVSQIRREIADRVVLLIPRSRSVLWSHASRWSASPRLGALREQITVAAIEDIIEAVAEDSLSPHMPNQLAGQLATKYSLANDRSESTARGALLQRRYSSPDLR